MNDNIKKLEEITSFLQNEVSQMSDVIYSQQKDIINLKSEISKLKKVILELEDNLDLNLSDGNQKPPHY
jgi:SlyX protein|tara:strand:- start:1719 stop:1925 length:207 start_codon:yes stop_codon:yes gene_type:complete